MVGEKAFKHKLLSQSICLPLRAKVMSVCACEHAQHMQTPTHRHIHTATRAD